MSTARVPGAQRGTGTVVISPMRRRHLRGVVAIENRVNHRPWSHSLFAGELRLPDTRRYVVALDGAVVSGGALAVSEDKGAASVAAGTTEGAGTDTAALAGTSRAPMCLGRRASSIATRVPDRASSATTVNTAVTTLRRSLGECA